MKKGLLALSLVPAIARPRACVEAADLVPCNLNYFSINLKLPHIKPTLCMLNNNTIAIYMIIDDILQAIDQREDSTRVVNDSLLLTTALIAAWYFGGNWTTPSTICVPSIAPRC